MELAVNLPDTSLPRRRWDSLCPTWLSSTCALALGRRARPWSRIHTLLGPKLLPHRISPLLGGSQHAMGGFKPGDVPIYASLFHRCSNDIYCATARRADGYNRHRGIHTSGSNRCPAWRLEFWPSSVVDATNVLDQVNRWWRVNSSPEHQSTVNPPIAVGADYRRSFLGYVTPTAFATFRTTHTRRRLGFGRRIALG
jgi:hypothetical protein